MDMQPSVHKTFSGLLISYMTFRYELLSAGAPALRKRNSKSLKLRICNFNTQDVFWAADFEFHP